MLFGTRVPPQLTAPAWRAKPRGHIGGEGLFLRLFELDGTDTDSHLVTLQALGILVPTRCGERPRSSVLRGPRFSARPRSSGVGADRKCGQAVHERAFTPAQRARVAVRGDVGEAAQELPDRDLPFQPGQRRADAVVNAVPERDVAGVLPGDVEPVRV